MDLDTVDSGAKASWKVPLVRCLLPIGWCFAALGYFGPWIQHDTAALTLNGADMGEFVKFLPGALDGSLKLVRQFFYLPPFATVASLALLINAATLSYGRLVRVLGVLVAIPVSLQLLPPAWSPSALASAEFRTQTLGLLICWLLLASSWLLRRLPTWLTGLTGAILCGAALLLTTWQFQIAMPAIDTVYSAVHSTGWGFLLCLIGLGVCVVVSVLLVLTAGPGIEKPKG